MKQEKVIEALNKLENRGIICKNSDDRNYYFTGLGHSFTNKKSKSNWIAITNYYCSYLWVRSEPSRNYSWIFKSFDSITEEMFRDFCEYFEIDYDNGLYEVTDEFEDI